MRMEETRSNLVGSVDQHIAAKVRVEQRVGPFEGDAVAFFIEREHGAEG